MLFSRELGMKDKHKSKKQLIAELEGMRNRNSQFERLELARKTFLELLSTLDKSIDLVVPALSTGSWTWDIGSDEVVFRLDPPYDSDPERKRLQLSGPWERITGEEYLSPVRIWLRSVIENDAISDTTLLMTTDNRILVMSYGPVEQSDHASSKTVEGLFKDITPLFNLIPKDLAHFAQEGDVAGMLAQYHLDKVMRAATVETLGLLWRQKEQVYSMIENQYRKSSELQQRISAAHARVDKQNLTFVLSVICMWNGAVFLKDAEKRFVYVSPATTDILGLSKSQVLGRMDRELFERSDWQIDESVSCENETGCVCRFINKGEESVAQELWLCTLPFSSRSPDSSDGPAYYGFLLMRNQPPLDSQTKYRSKRMQDCEKQARKVAVTDRIVLLTGETGAGKDYVARYIHDNSRRAGGPFLSINCAAVPDTMAESELFGHEKGAFTGSIRLKKGLLELAEGGTLVLNEIGELSLPVQAKLLQFLDTKRIIRVGGKQEIDVNARLIVATNRDLDQEVAEDNFRRDLLYRINKIEIKVPPARERQADLPIVVAELLERIKQEDKLPYTPFADDATIARMARKKWPGNIREIENILIKAMVLHGGPRLQMDSLLEAIPDIDDSVITEIQENESAPVWTWRVSFPPPMGLEDLAKDMKRALIYEAIRRAGGNKTKAARLLRITRDSIMRQIRTLRKYYGPETQPPE